MKEGGRGGRILLTTSASGLLGNFGQASYGAAKMGLVGLMRTLRIEGEKAGIKVNALAPIAGTRLTGAPVDDDAPKGPGKVAPIAVALAHAQCPTNGEIYMAGAGRSEEQTSELQSLMRNSYAVFCLHKQQNQN